MEELKRAKAVLFERLTITQKKIEHARQILNMQEDKWRKLHLEYMRVDRELAMKDGRYKVIPEGASARKASPAKLIISLTKDQIARIAECLGVELEEGDEDEV